MEEPHTPGSDCNSNPATDSEFIQDNVEYQWFIDYGYRDGGLHLHPSVLSSLSASYSREDLGYYDDLSRNLDANLAEIDMESFRTADIHTLLTALPVMCTDPAQHSEGEDSACSTTDTISICKSSLLFSPLKETPVLPSGGSYSVDSLDCEDMLLTCQANNKNNYTIAFEGSITMYSDGSQDFENQDKYKTYDASEAYYETKSRMRNILDLSMACSDSKIYTTWSNLKHSSMNKAMARHPSGNNNNTIPNIPRDTSNNILATGKKSQSLPDLRRTRERQYGAALPLNFSVDSADSNNHQNPSVQSAGSAMSRSVNEGSFDSSSCKNSSGKKLQNMSLVRLFMKQKSTSAEGMSLTLDQSGSISDGGWPSSQSDSESATNTNTNTNTNTQIHRPNVNESASARNPHRVPSADGDFSINWLQKDCCENRSDDIHQLTATSVNGNGNGNDNDSGRSSLAKRTPSRLGRASAKEESASDGGSVSVSVSVSIDDSSGSLSVISDLDRKNDCRKSKPGQPTATRKTRNAWVSAEKRCQISKTTGVQAIAETEDDGVQTSLVYDVASEKNGPSLRETIVNDKPVYVVYPNYTLPDLSFLAVKDPRLDNVALRPQRFAETRGKWKNKGNGGRPFSCNDIDALKQRGFSHIKDWESLTFLLPMEYKKILHDVPEISKHIRDMNEEVRKPLFCLSPPMRHRNSRAMTTDTGSSTSSTATQPSSGYRGSSTILTDSSTNQQQQQQQHHQATATAPTPAPNPLYLYRYSDSISPEGSVVRQDERKNVQRFSGMGQGTAGPFSKRSISLPQGSSNININNNERQPAVKVPPRPPLPRSILRKNRVGGSKRYSMFEIGGGLEEIEDRPSESNKRMSLQEPYYMNNDLRSLLRRGKIYDSEKDVDETEEAVENGEIAGEVDDIRQLEEFLKRSGFSSESSEADTEQLTEAPDVKLRSYVRRFLALRMNRDSSRGALALAHPVDTCDSQRKTVSFAMSRAGGSSRENRHERYDNRLHPAPSGNGRECDCDYEYEYACEYDYENENEDESESAKENRKAHGQPEYDEKRRMIRAVDRAVEQLIEHFEKQASSRTKTASKATTAGPAATYDHVERNECAKICLSGLCPALYAIMSDGLKPHLNSTFGPIGNSVWQVVEASSQQGPLTKTLNELVRKINGEDVITEGMLKFHAFVFGLLNLRALDAWFAYLCTRESILRKHYTASSLFIGAFADTTARGILDSFLLSLNRLELCPFQLDLLYQYRQLRNSFGNINNPPAIFPSASSSRHALDRAPKEQTNTPTPAQQQQGFPAKVPSSPVRRTRPQPALTPAGNNSTNVKLHRAAEKWRGEEDPDDYTDSLEHSPIKRPSRTKQEQPRSKPAAANASARNNDDDDDDDDDVNDVSISSEAKFRKLRDKWEQGMCYGSKDDVPTKNPASNASPSSPARTPLNNSGKSKIPRLLTSPVKHGNASPTTAANAAAATATTTATIPTGIPTGKPANRLPPSSNIPTSARKSSAAKSTAVRGRDTAPEAPAMAPVATTTTTTRRTSRLDQESAGTTAKSHHPSRPSSLPYNKSQAAQSKEKSLASPQRRAASTSLPRPNTAATPNARNSTAARQAVVKEVRTLTHRAPSDNGQLSFVEGERLRVILEVDARWLLCAKADRRGLVPRSCVLALQT